MAVDDILKQTGAIFQGSGGGLIGGMQQGIQLGIGLQQAKEKMALEQKALDMQQEQYNMQKAEKWMAIMERATSAKTAKPLKKTFLEYANKMAPDLGMPQWTPEQLDMFKADDDFALKFNALALDYATPGRTTEETLKKRTLINAQVAQLAKNDPEQAIMWKNTVAPVDKAFESSVQGQIREQSAATARDANSLEFRLKSVREALNANPYFKTGANFESLLDQAYAGNKQALGMVEREVTKARAISSKNAELDRLITKGVPEQFLKGLDRSNPVEVDQAVARASNFIAKKEKQEREKYDNKQIHDLRKEVGAIGKEFRKLEQTFALAEVNARQSPTNPAARIPMIKAIQQFNDSPRVTDAELKLSTGSADAWTRVKQFVLSYTEGGKIPDDVVQDIAKVMPEMAQAVQSVKREALSPYWEETKLYGYAPNRIFEKDDLRALGASDTPSPRGTAPTKSATPKTKASTVEAARKGAQRLMQAMPGMAGEIRRKFKQETGLDPDF